MSSLCIQDETSYLEAAPQPSAPAHAQQSEGGLNEESTEQQQPQTQAQATTSRQAGPSRAQTRAATGATAKRGSAVEPNHAGQTSQPQAAEDADASLTQLLGETHGVSVVNDDLNGVYF